MEIIDFKIIELIDRLWKLKFALNMILFRLSLLQNV